MKQSRRLNFLSEGALKTWASDPILCIYESNKSGEKGKMLAASFSVLIWFCEPEETASDSSTLIDDTDAHITTGRSSSMKGISDVAPTVSGVRRLTASAGMLTVCAVDSHSRATEEPLPPARS